MNSLSDEALREVSGGTDALRLLAEISVLQARDPLSDSSGHWYLPSRKTV